MSSSDIQPTFGDDSFDSDNLQTSAEATTQLCNNQMIGGRFAFCIVLLMILLADACLYHSEGFFGPAAFLCGAALLFVVAIPNRSFRWNSLGLMLAILLLCWRLCVNGFALQLFAGFWLLTALILTLRRQTPFVLETFLFAAQSIHRGYQFFHGINNRVRRRIPDPIDQRPSSRLVEIALPVFVAALFSGIFIMANPDVVSWVSSKLSRILDATTRFLFRFSIYEVMFWGIVAWLTGGLLRPVGPSLLTQADTRDSAAWGSSQAPLYAAFRNTLLTVNVVFGIYLTFESRAWLTSELPRGFTYSSYAHEGAAWLTVALALSTLTLSLIFRGRTLCDPRLKRLKTLAWVWSAFNLILAAAVYNRLWIYVDFNGMTRMRVIGLLGITSVVVGFSVVLLKIGRHRNFRWLIQRQLCVVTLAAYTYAILPVDSIIHTYNVAKITRGNEAPTVQITAHDVDDEALPVLLPLCSVEDPRLSRGIQAMLSIRFEELNTKMAAQEALGWTARQLSQDRAFSELQSSRHLWDTHRSIGKRNEAWKQLRDHAYREWW